MAGPSIDHEFINTNGNRIYSKIFSFSGGGTQTVLTLNAGEVWLLYSIVYNYGGTDFRHGDLAYAAKTINGTPSSTIRFATLADFGNSAFSDNGSGGVQYSAGGGNPFTNVYMLRIL